MICKRKGCNELVPINLARRGYVYHAKSCAPYGHLSPSGGETKGQRSLGLRHGTLTGYTKYSCRCDLCKSAAVAYQTKWRENRKQSVTV